MRNNHLLRLKVGIILNVLLLGCMVLFLSLSPLLISWVKAYFDSGDSIFFPLLLTRIDILPLTLGQFLDQCLIFSLLWFVLSSFFPLVRKIRDRLRAFPDQMYLQGRKETAPCPRSWLLSDITHWENCVIIAPKYCGRYPDVKKEWGLISQRSFAKANKDPLLNCCKFRRNRYLVSSSSAPLWNWHDFCSVFSLARFRFPRIRYDHSFLNFVSSHHGRFPGAIFRLVFLEHHESVRISHIVKEVAKSSATGEMGGFLVEGRNFVKLWTTSRPKVNSIAGGEGI